MIKRILVIALLSVTLTGCLVDLFESMDEEEKSRQNEMKMTAIIKEKKLYYKDFELEYGILPILKQIDSINSFVDSLVQKGYIINGRSVTTGMVTEMDTFFLSDLGRDYCQLTISYYNHQKKITNQLGEYPPVGGNKKYKIGDELQIEYEMNDTIGVGILREYMDNNTP